MVNSKKKYFRKIDLNLWSFSEFWFFDIKKELENYQNRVKYLELFRLECINPTQSYTLSFFRPTPF